MEAQKECNRQYKATTPSELEEIARKYLQVKIDILKCEDDPTKDNQRKAWKKEVRELVDAIQYADHSIRRDSNAQNIMLSYISITDTFNITRGDYIQCLYSTESLFDNLVTARQSTRVLATLLKQGEGRYSKKYMEMRKAVEGGTLRDYATRIQGFPEATDGARQQLETSYKKVYRFNMILDFAAEQLQVEAVKYFKLPIDVIEERTRVFNSHSDATRADIEASSFPTTTKTQLLRWLNRLFPKVDYTKWQLSATDREKEREKYLAQELRSPWSTKLQQFWEDNLGGSD